MSDIVQNFEDRMYEIEIYLDLLDAIEKQIQEGPPRIGETGPIISVQQQRILYSSVFLQLYNLVEATVTNCIEAVVVAIVNQGSWKASDLSNHVRREWVRSIARTHIDLTSDNRLVAALEMCEYLVQNSPVPKFSVEKAGGSWDDKAIENVSSRIGLNLKVSENVFENVKKPFRDDKGPLVFIKTLRNNLAHGTQSFVECGDGVTVRDLRDLKDRTSSYLKEVVSLFGKYIDEYEFLLPDRRPKSTGTSAQS